MEVQLGFCKSLPFKYQNRIVVLKIFTYSKGAGCELCNLNPEISIWEKSKLVELSSIEIALVVGVNCVGCLIAITLQFNLFPILLWAIANLYTPP